MTNIYRLQVRAMCPIHADLIDVYDVEIRSGATLPVENILAHFKQYETQQIFQEEMTRKACVALGGSIKTVGIHSGVEVTSLAP